MNILDLIKQRASTRQYLDKPISKKIMEQILEAGIWGPAIHHFQPWKFIVVNNNISIKKLATTVMKKLHKKDIPAFITYPTSSPLLNAKVLIFVYNTNELINEIKKQEKKYFKRLESTEISAISAAIQNMILVAESLGIGSCWLNAPLFCEKEINRLLDVKNRLVATLAFGYPAVKGKRSLRKPLKASIQYKNNLGKNNI